jgi:hypothetical protein
MAEHLNDIEWCVRKPKTQPKMLNIETISNGELKNKNASYKAEMAINNGNA